MFALLVWGSDRAPARALEVVHVGASMTVSGTRTKVTRSRRTGRRRVTRYTAWSYSDALDEVCPAWPEPIVAAREGAHVQTQRIRLLPPVRSELEERGGADLAVLSPSINWVFASWVVPELRAMIAELRMSGVKKIGILLPSRNAIRSVLRKRRLRRAMRRRRLRSALANIEVIDQMGWDEGVNWIYNVDEALTRSPRSRGCDYCSQDGWHWSRLGKRRVASAIAYLALRSEYPSRQDLPEDQRSFERLSREFQSLGYCDVQYPR